MHIRLAEPGDRDEISALNQRFNGCPGHFEALDEHSETIMVAEVDGQLVGFACLQVTHSVCAPEPGAELTELYVDEASRRRAIGTALVAEAERQARNRGCRELVLRTNARNLGACTFFARAGYGDAGHVTFRKQL